MPAKPHPDAPSELIDARIEELADWRGKTLARVRRLIKAAVPDVVEEWKWRGVPVWEHDGIICTGETYKAAVKLTFAKGASLEDPAGLFNASLDGNVRRAIDLHEGDTIDEKAFKALIRAAAALNSSRRPAAKAKRQRVPHGPRSRPSSAAATHRSRRPTATPPCRPTSTRCRAGNAMSGDASMRSSCAPSRTCARR